MALPLIRDAETESYLKQALATIVNADSSPYKVNIHLVNQPTPNAFVMAGRDIFVTYGLLLAIEDSRSLIGVLAHELGHIDGAHVVRGIQEREQISNSLMTATLIGLAGAIGGGSPEAGMAMVSAGSHAGLRSMLSSIRRHEHSADAFAMKLLYQQGVSSQGLVDFMQTLQQYANFSDQVADQYLQTHPLTKDRIRFLQQHPSRELEQKTRQIAKLNQWLPYIQGKVRGFLHHKEPKSDYGKWIFHARLASSHDAKAYASILNNHPYPHYATMTLANIMLDYSHKPNKALAIYNDIRGIDSPLLFLQKARAYQAIDEHQEAIRYFKIYAMEEPKNPTPWKYLAKTYASIDMPINAWLAEAEKSIRLNNKAKLKQAVRKLATMIANKTTTAEQKQHYARLKEYSQSDK